MSDPANVVSALPERVGAVLFDMDNTLVRSEQAWFDAAAQLWGTVDVADKVELGGTVESTVAAYLADHPDADAGAVDVRYRALLREYLPRIVEPMPGAGELLAALAGRVPMTIASNSPTEIVRWVVDALGWGHVFTATLGTDDVDHHKPAPDLYLAAAAACGAEAATCVVFEDSPMGTQAGRAAGAFVVTVGPAAAGRGDVAVESLAEVVDWNPEVCA